MSLNGRVLLLNATFEPLGTVGIARAMLLLFRNTVAVEEWEEGRVLRTARDEYPVPSVVRLRAYVNVRRRRNSTGARRLRIYMRDRFRCQYCGLKSEAAQLTLDHIYPRSRGGRSAPENLVTACVGCNSRKSDRTPEEARMPLLTAQSLLRVQLDRVALCHYAETRPEWRKYLYLDEDFAARDEHRRRAH